MIKNALFALMGILLFGVSASADLTTGYYTFKNVGYDGYYMYEDFSSNCVRATNSYASGDFEKVWKVTMENGRATIQNVYTGHYIQHQSSTSSTFLTAATSDGAYDVTTNSDGSYMFGHHMHCDAAKNIVLWNDAGNNHSYWVLESVNLTDAQVTAAQNEFKAIEAINTNASSYNTSLSTFFTDLSCSELKSKYKSYTDANLKKAMNSLPTALQNIAVNVKNGWSGEGLASQFRVREYKPYTRANVAHQKLNATQFNDMSNPTGIYADSKEDLYVFVGGDIPTGCELRIAGAVGNSRVNYNTGVELKKGVNAIKASANRMQYWIMYTYTGDTEIDMSTLASLKIHIEGGNVLGFVDATGLTESEVNTEYKKVLDNANALVTAKSIDDGELNFVVKGNRGVFFFPLDTYNAIWAGTNYGSYTYDTYHIGKSLAFFDDVLKWEWGLMGFTDRVANGETEARECVIGGVAKYPSVYNNLALTLQNAEGTNPFSTTFYTSMPGVGGVESSYNAERVNFDNWCVGHESGHNNQGLINLPSSTEASNNLFSNVIQYQWGYRMSRGEGITTSNNDYVNGTQFALRDIGSTHRMYWQLYLYYHLAQNKTSFYPSLFAILRENPLNLNQGTCFTEFYKAVCDAAQEDLTDYFTVWGFLQPFENTTFGDYTTRTLSLAQADIDAAIEYVKGKYTVKNERILFIEDRTETAERWDPHTTGTTELKVSSDGNAVTTESLQATYGVTGSVASMTTSAAVSQSQYVYSIVDGNLVLEGTTGGAGVIVYDNDGNIIAYGNGTTIALPTEYADYTKIVVKAVDNTNGMATVLSVMESGNDEQMLAVLQSQIEAAEAMIAMSDNTEKKVGYYKTICLTDLKTLVSEANAAISAGTPGSYANLIYSLTEEISSIRSNANSKVQIVEGKSYSIRNKAYTSRYATISDNALATTTNTPLTDAEKWQFVDAGNGTYYVKNVSSDTYVSYSKTSTQIQANATSTDGTATESTTDVAYTYNIVGAGDGTYYLQANESSGYKCWHSAASADYNIVGWNTGAQASYWYITCEDTDPIETGTLYMIVSARSGWDMGKAMTATTKINGEGDDVYPGWETTDVEDLEQFWYFESTGTDNVYKIKNYGTGTYIASATSMNTSGANISVEEYSSGLYTLTISGSTDPLHCRFQQDGYSSASLTEWEAAAGNASLWYIVPVDTKRTITYKTDDNKWSKSYEVVIGDPYPEAPATTVMVTSITGVPTGNVTKDETFVLEYTTRYAVADSPENVSQWYALDIHGNEAKMPLYAIDGDEYIRVEYDTSSGTVDADEYTEGAVKHDGYMWAFVGNPFTGVKLYNKGAKKYAYQKNDADEKVSFADQGTVFELCTTNGDVRNSFCLKVSDREYYINHRGLYVQGWKENDAGSSLRAYVINEADMNLTQTISAEYGTLVLPFYAEIPEGLQLFTCSEVDGTILTLDSESGYIKPYTAYIIQGTPNTTYTYKNTSCGTRTDEVVTTGMLKGILADNVTVPSGSYILTRKKVNGEYTAQGFYQLGYDLTGTKYRCYLDGGLAASPAFYLTDEDGLTGVDQIQSLENDSNAPIYDLQGRKVVNIIKGEIYIKNGKTFIVR